MQLHGAWPDALEEAERARERSERAMNVSAAGQALYQQAELRRLRGDFVAAEPRTAKRMPTDASRSPASRCCGSRRAMLDAAARGDRPRARRDDRAARRARCCRRPSRSCSRVGDADGARRASVELDEIAGSLRSPLLGAVADAARGAVELAEGDARAALVSLRLALQRWQELDAPYEIARTRVLVATRMP